MRGKCPHGRQYGQACSYCYRENNCPYCAKGNAPNEKGDHWIVKSIIPAKIDIRKCKAVRGAKAQ